MMLFNFKIKQTINQNGILIGFIIMNDYRLQQILEYSPGIDKQIEVHLSQIMPNKQKYKSKNEEIKLNQQQKYGKQQQIDFECNVQPYQKANQIDFIRIPLFKNVKLINGDRVFQNLLKQTYIQSFQRKQIIPWFQTRKFFVYVHQGKLNLYKVSINCQIDTLRSQKIAFSKVGLRKSLIKSFKKGQYWGYQDFGFSINDKTQVQAQSGCVIYFCPLQSFYLSFRRVIPLNTIQNKVQYIKKIFIYLNDNLKTKSNSAISRSSNTMAQRQFFNDLQQKNIDQNLNQEKFMLGTGVENSNLMKLMPYIQRRTSNRNQIIFHKNSKIQFLYFLFDGKCQIHKDKISKQKTHFPTTRIETENQIIGKTMNNFSKNIEQQKSFRKYSKYERFQTHNNYDFKNYQEGKNSKTENYFHSMSHMTNKSKLPSKNFRRQHTGIFAKNTCFGLEQILNGQECFKDTIKSIYQSQFLLIPKTRFQILPQVKKRIKKAKDTNRLNALLCQNLKDNFEQKEMDTIQRINIQNQHSLPIQLHFKQDNVINNKLFFTRRDNQQNLQKQERNSSYNFRVKTQHLDNIQAIKSLKRPLTAQSNNNIWKHNTEMMNISNRSNFIEDKQCYIERRNKTQSSFTFTEKYAKKLRVHSAFSRSELFMNRYQDRKTLIQQNQIIKYVRSKAPQLMINPNKQFALVKPLHTKQSNYIKNYKRKLKKCFVHSDVKCMNLANEILNQND